MRSAMDCLNEADRFERLASGQADSMLRAELTGLATGWRGVAIMALWQEWAASQLAVPA